jgi:hypothetical protein
VGKPSSFYAYGLQDFCDKIQKVNVESLEFHMNRGDFENWFTCLGDIELAKKLELLNVKNLCGEELRQKLHTIVENRCTALSTIS